MSTRARIGLLQKNGAVLSVYTHWDGYPSHHGPILLQHYSTPARLEKLFELGNLSVLHEKLGEKTSSDTPAKDQCISYSRDWDREEEETLFSKDLEEFFRMSDGVSYMYVAQRSGNILEWKVAPLDRRGVLRQAALFRPLAEVVQEEREEG